MTKGRKIYKQHFACFECRKVFKRTNKVELSEELRKRDQEGLIVYCPQCHGRLRDVGFAFKPPKQADAKAWEEYRTYLEKSFDYQIRNSHIANQEQYEKFSKEYDEERKRKDLLRSISRKRLRSLG